MEYRNQNYTGRNWEATPTKQIPHLCSDPLPPKVGALGIQASRHNPERRGLHRVVWKAVGSNPFSNQSPHPMVCYAVDSVTGTLDKVLH